VMASVQRTVCRGHLPNGEVAECEFYRVCGYQKQLKRKNVGLWFVAHEMIFGSMPSALGKVVLLIVDESFWADGLVGASGNRPGLDLEDFEEGCSIPGAPLQSERQAQKSLDYDPSPDVRDDVPWSSERVDKTVSAAPAKLGHRVAHGSEVNRTRHAVEGLRRKEESRSTRGSYRQSLRERVCAGRRQTRIDDVEVRRNRR